MRISSILFSTIGLLTFCVPAANAQCFARNLCDPTLLEVRSQISVNVPIASPASAETALKATEDARKQLLSMANRECKTLHEIFGGECTLSSVNMNSSMQDRGNFGTTVAFVSINNTYTVKKAAK